MFEEEKQTLATKIQGIARNMGCLLSPWNGRDIPFSGEWVLPHRFFLWQLRYPNRHVPVPQHAQLLARSLAD